MKKISLFFISVMATAFVQFVSAQVSDLPKYEIFGGYYRGHDSTTDADFCEHFITDIKVNNNIITGFMLETCRPYTFYKPATMVCANNLCEGTLLSSKGDDGPWNLTIKIERPSAYHFSIENTVTHQKSSGYMYKTAYN